MKLPFSLPISVLATGANTALPALPAWKAASFWAQLLLILSVIFNAVGIDIFAVFSDMGLGASPEEVIATGERAVSAVQQLLPLVFGIWAWLERSAPSFRLTFWERG
ncbi:hypothetical protein [Paracoccus denitrificans]|uniref:hypothetical protein n=1 Tax=Paracoccus denitrificans TaxID=266 RepID=UPI003365064D